MGHFLSAFCMQSRRIKHAFHCQAFPGEIACSCSVVEMENKKVLSLPANYSNPVSTWHIKQLLRRNIPDATYIIVIPK